jgi:MFS transporter, ACDE family, multidrug resistance protein
MPEGDVEPGQPRPLSRREIRARLILAHGSAAVVLGGVQAIVPALPGMQSAFALSDSQIGLVSSLYLLPAVLFAIPSGYLADRFGRRFAFVAATAVFALSGLGVLMTTTFPALLALRVVQGMAFATVLPLSVTLVGDLLRGVAQVREQSVRMLFITGSDMSLTLAGGILATISWRTPFLLHALALPVAVLGWRLLPASGPPTTRSFSMRDLGVLLRTPLAMSIQILSLLRFMFKFAALSYLPILFASRGWSAPGIAAALGLMAGFALFAALLSRWIMPLLRVTLVLRIGLVATGAAYLAVATIESVPVTILAMAALGFAEGFVGVGLNAATLEGVDDAERSMFVASVASVRNLGKFAAPAMLGTMVVWLPLSYGFIVVAVIAVLATFAVAPMRALNDAMMLTDRRDDPSERRTA